MTWEEIVTEAVERKAFTGDDIKKALSWKGTPVAERLGLTELAEEDIKKELACRPVWRRLEQAFVEAVVYQQPKKARVVLNEIMRTEVPVRLTS